MWTANVEMLPAGGDLWGWTARRGFLDKLGPDWERWVRLGQAEREGSSVGGLGGMVTRVPGQAD